MVIKNIQHDGALPILLESEVSWSIAEQRADVLSGIRTQMALASKWEPISMAWMLAWKDYVHYDIENAVELSEPDLDKFPGPINNNPLSGRRADCIRRDLSEGKDYILLPSRIASKLFQFYGGGPRFIREAGYEHPSYRLVVKMFPIRVELFPLTLEQPEPSTENFKVKILVDAKTLYDIKTSAEESISNYSSKRRYWVKLNESDGQSEDNSESADKVSSLNYKTSESVSKIKIGNCNWKRVSDFSESLSLYLDKDDVLKIIVEQTDKFYPTDKEWPLHYLADGWKQCLQRGDVIDCLDDSKTWSEAIVMSADGVTKDLTVHYRGWSSTFDEVILKSKFADCVLPVFTKTINWRAKLEVDDQIDLKISRPNEKALWLPATITAIDPISRQITVELKKSAVHSAAFEHKIKSIFDGVCQDMDSDFSDDVYSSPMNGSVVDDDIKKQSLALENVKSRNIMDNEDMFLNHVVDFESDDICALHTHTKSLRTASKSYGYGNQLTLPKHNNFSSGTSYTSYGHSGNSVGSNTYSYSYGGFSSNDDGEDAHVPGKPLSVGAVGLRNLGNTCFMNSILQCLSNSTPITQLFITDAYKYQINYDNPLGHGGKLAQVYAKLMKAMWSANYSIVVPRQFKKTIGEFQPQFAGYEQHDSQELMGFLLDGLHEDLNRVQKKPFVEAIESNGRPDDLMSRESWRRFLLRNNSELVDVLYGQTKSHVTCANCLRESVTFEAFNCLSVPIPVKNTRVLTLTVLLLPLGSLPVKINVEIALNSTVLEVKRAAVRRLIELELIDADAPSRSDSEVDMKLSETAGVDDHSQAPNDNESDSGFSKGNDASRIVQVKKSKPNASKDEMVHGRYFHLCAIYGMGYRIFSTFSNSQSIGKPGGNAEILYLVELAHPVAARSATTSYAYKQPSVLSSSLEAETPSIFAYVDVLFSTDAKKSPSIYSNVTSSYTPSVLMGWPVRLAYDKESLTYAQLHQHVRQLAACHLLSPEANTSAHTDDAESPFEVYRSNLSGTEKKNLLPVSDNLVSFSTFESILVHFKAGEPRRSLELGDLKPYVKPGEASAVTYDASEGERTTDEDTAVVGPSSSTAVSTTSMDDIDEDDYWQSSSSTTLSTSYGRNASSSSRVTLQQCLDAFAIREKLPDSETLYCSGCKQHLPPFKKMDIWAAPDLLIIHLKRFQYIQGTYSVQREKLSELVDFPVEGLDLSGYVKGPVNSAAPPIYDLYAVSHHSGNLYGGHYTAMCKNSTTNKWYSFNDTNVSETTPDRAVSELAYVLFYKRRSGSLKWGGLEPLTEPIDSMNNA